MYMDWVFHGQIVSKSVVFLRKYFGMQTYYINLLKPTKSRKPKLVIIIDI